MSFAELLRSASWMQEAPTTAGPVNFKWAHAVSGGKGMVVWGVPLRAVRSTRVQNLESWKAQEVVWF